MVSGKKKDESVRRKAATIKEEGWRKGTERKSRKNTAKEHSMGREFKGGIQTEQQITSSKERPWETTARQSGGKKMVTPVIHLKTNHE